MRCASRPRRALGRRRHRQCGLGPSGHRASRHPNRRAQTPSPCHWRQRPRPSAGHGSLGGTSRRAGWDGTCTGPHPGDRPRRAVGGAATRQRLAARQRRGQPRPARSRVEGVACQPRPSSPPPAGGSHIPRLCRGCTFVRPRRALADSPSGMERQADGLVGHGNRGLARQLRRQQPRGPWALGTPTSGGARSMLRRRAACHSGGTVRAIPDACCGGRAAPPPGSKRVRTRSTVSWLRKTLAAIAATKRP